MTAAADPIAERLSQLEEFVVSGFVLDDNGNWVPMAELRKIEEDVLNQLCAGKVLHEGQWLTFDEVHAAQSANNAAPPSESAPMPDIAPPETQEEETRVFQTPEEETRDFQAPQEETRDFPPPQQDDAWKCELPPEEPKATDPDAEELSA